MTDVPATIMDSELGSLYTPRHQEKDRSFYGDEVLLFFGLKERCGFPKISTAVFVSASKKNKKFFSPLKPIFAQMTHNL